MSEFLPTEQSPAPLSDPPAPRAAQRARQWRDGLAKAFAHAAGRARDAGEQERVWQAYEQELESGPDFTRYRGRSEFREAPGITADRNALTRIRFKLMAIANGSWASKARGKHAGLVQHSTIRVFDALCNLARKHGRVFPSHKGIAYLAKCSKNTVISALRQLEFFGFVAIFRRLKRIRTPLGARVVQDTNAYMPQEPNRWGCKALALFTGFSWRSSESNKGKARGFNFLIRGAGK